jgi:hypothetical protein
MLDKNIPNHFKVSNDPTLIGWNPTMSIQLILTQLETLFGKPSDALTAKLLSLFWREKNSHFLVGTYSISMQE